VKLEPNSIKLRVGLDYWPAAGTTQPVWATIPVIPSDS
jgi:hypothetical protein